MKIALFYKENKIESSYIEDLTKKLSSCGFDLDNDNPEAVLYVGGDGTFLRAVHKYLKNIDNLVFVGLKKGHLGFFTSYNENEIDQLLSDLKSKNIDCKSYRLLKASFADSELYAVNEIRIENPFQTLISEVEINGSRLETFRGNGLTVSSALGSSAYNRSLGGAIVSTDLDVLELTEIAPINNRVFRSLHSPLVLSSNSTIVLKPKTKNVLVGYDHLTIEDENSSVIKFELSDKKVSILRKKDFDYISHLNKTFIEEE